MVEPQYVMLFKALSTFVGELSVISDFLHPINRMGTANNKRTILSGAFMVFGFWFLKKYDLISYNILSEKSSNA